MIYLASPYSHADPAVREARYQAVCRATAAMLKAGGSRRLTKAATTPMRGPRP